MMAKRKLVKCPACKGKGTIEYGHSVFTDWRTCEKCGGKGKVLTESKP